MIDDLTDLLRAQKAAAWQEVAQRIAHEIKNPLTPIQLSAQRLLRYLERSVAERAGGAAHAILKNWSAECAGLIEREVQTLKVAGGRILAVRALPCRAACADGFEFDRRKARWICSSGRLDGITVQIGPCGDAAAGESRSGTAAARGGEPDRQRGGSHGGLDDSATARDRRARKAMATPSKSKFPTAGTEFRRRTRNGFSCRIFRRKNAGPDWASRSPAGSLPSITAPFASKIIFRRARVS